MPTFPQPQNFIDSRVMVGTNWRPSPQFLATFADSNPYFYGKTGKNQYWLVVDLPLWNIWKSVGMMTFMFQTTNQNLFCLLKIVLIQSWCRLSHLRISPIITCWFIISHHRSFSCSPRWWNMAKSPLDFTHRISPQFGRLEDLFQKIAQQLTGAFYVGLLDGTGGCWDDILLLVIFLGSSPQIPESFSTHQ